MTIVLFAVIGAALDYGKWHNAYTHVEGVVDRALLAAGRQFQTSPDQPELALEAARAYFDEAALKGIVVDGIAADFKVTNNPLGIEGTVKGAVKTPFLSLVNVSTLEVNMTSKAEFGIGGGANGGSELEVSIMLDVTESMCDGGIGPCTAGSKMTAMKTAAKDLVNIVLGANASQTLARVAIVPFSTRVRLDDETSVNAGHLMKKVTDMDPTFNGWHNDCETWTGTATAGANSESAGSGTWDCSSWKATQVNWKILPCVTDRTGPEEFTDAAPTSNAWLNANDGGRAPYSWDSSDTPITDRDGKTEATAYDGWNYTEDGMCWDITAPNYILPLSSDANAVKQRIDALEGYGSTAGALGTAWAWYLISPNWNNVWNGNSAPGSYADLAATSNAVPKLRKIAVLMTDGDYNTYRAWKDYDPILVSNNAKQICTNMKAQGIEVFTVGFDLDSLPAAQKARATDTLQSCGTDIQHFYNSLDGTELQNAFRDIALKLSQLYLAK